MNRYDPSHIEPKWQQIWADDARYKAPDASDKPKFYVSGMFPYPSGAGMHTGHFFEHSIVDAVARFRRSLGHNVMYPMGWDSFGLPAENYAIKTGKAPAVTTKENIASFKNQLTRVGASIDWSREINTADPEYYKWTQWVFTKLFERDLAYQKESLQWWCPHDLTVLANEQVEGGKCWRCGNEVVKKSMKQWFFKITEYADALLEEIPALDWPEKIKSAQTNWIGKSQGVNIGYRVANSDEVITCFTTTPVNYGMTFIVLAPEHEAVLRITSPEQRQVVLDYIEACASKTEVQRLQDGKEKTGVFTGSYVTNPFNGEQVPVWIADFVLAGFGTGAVQGCPAHDERDFEFAKNFNLPIVRVVEGPNGETDKHVDRESEAVDQVKQNHGIKRRMVNSRQFDGMEFDEAMQATMDFIVQQGWGERVTNYKMRDWLISRQRYWGAPIPIIHCEKDGVVAVPESDLPVLLPSVEDYAPRGDGKSVLAAQTDWVNTTCPTCGGPAKRETDTMDGYACSSWYLLRFTDPKNAEQAWAPEKADYWSPIDMYLGGDHAVAHLLYVRFWNHVFYDMGLVPSKEPVKQLVYHGLIQAEDGRKMSKSLGNVVDPLEVIDQGYGADALRTFELFLGPINENSSWSSRGIAGVYRFLNRYWTLVQEYQDSDKTAESDTAKLHSITHATIKKVTDDVQRLSFNTAIAALMEYVNDLYKLKVDGFSDEWQSSLETLIKLVQPFAPHMSAELWQQLGHETQLDFESWPEFDESKIVTDGLTLAVQINGKVRAEILVSSDARKDDIEAAALAHERVQEFLGGNAPKRVIYVQGRLVNIVI